MPVHKLEIYIDPPYKRVEFCTVCGQDSPIGDCPGEYKMSVKEQKAFDEQFKSIFACRY